VTNATRTAGHGTIRRHVARRSALALVALLLASTAAGAVDLHRADLRALVLRDPLVSAEVKRMVRGQPPGAGIDRAAVAHGDLTGDGRPDALVPVTAGPAAGIVAYYVYAETDGTVRDVFPVNAVYRARVALRARRLVETLPIYRRADPGCCPSAVQTTVYRWDGTGLAVQARSRAPVGRR
jgi:hypothetical protein